MISSLIQSLLSYSSQSINRTLQWLAPSDSPCPFCGKGLASPARNRSEQEQPHQLPKSFRLAICPTCLSSIPWLTRLHCRVCGRGIACGDCPRRSDAQFIANRSAVHYSSEMREWLAQYKYRGNERLEPLLAQMMIPAFLTLSKELSARSGFSFSSDKTAAFSSASLWDAVAYVPVSPERAEERGFNQAERLAALLSRQFHIPLAHLLVRERHTEKQSFKSRSERMRNTERLFTAVQGAINPFLQSAIAHYPPRILLIDDIYTTGSTIQACSEALQLQSSIPLEIYSLTWARS